MSAKCQENRTVWGYEGSAAAECWNGHCATREEAIKEGRKHYPGEAFFVMSGTRCDAASFMPDAAEVLEIAGERAGDEAGEAAADFPDVSQAAGEELDALLSAWSAKHLTCSFWVADSQPERIEPKGGA